MKPLRWLWLAIVTSLLAACGSTQPAAKYSQSASVQSVRAQQAAVKPVRNSPLHQDPLALLSMATEPSLVDALADEPLHPSANRPYSVMGVSYTPEVERKAYRARGKASWYGNKFHGRRTASGERYDMNELTAAHPTLPIPSFARVTNVKNGKSVIVRINDRGPFHKGRLIDLSYAAAHELGYVKRGSTDVVVERVWPNDGVKPAIDVAKAGKGIMPVAATGNDLALPASAVPAKGSWLQLGAYGSPSNAEAMRQRLAEQMAGSGSSARLEVVNHDGLYKLRLGPFVTPARAREVADQLKLGTALVRS